MLASSPDFYHPGNLVLKFPPLREVLRVFLPGIFGYRLAEGLSPFQVGLDCILGATTKLQQHCNFVTTPTAVQSLDLSRAGHQLLQEKVGDRFRAWLRIAHLQGVGFLPTPSYPMIFLH